MVTSGSPLMLKVHEDMHDPECTAFLQWALPRLDLRWAGFRKVRKQVCKRLKQRLRLLGLPEFTAYRDQLAANPEEWRVLDDCCRITISRFFRDRGVFETLGDRVLPEIAQRAMREQRDAQCWSAGCASGEEPRSGSCGISKPAPRRGCRSSRQIRTLPCSHGREEAAIRRRRCANYRPIWLRGVSRMLVTAFASTNDIDGTSSSCITICDPTPLWAPSTSFCAAIWPSRISRRGCSATSCCDWRIGCGHRGGWSSALTKDYRTRQCRDWRRSPPRRISLQEFRAQGGEGGRGRRWRRR